MTFLFFSPSRDIVGGYPGVFLDFFPGVFLEFSWNSQQTGQAGGGAVLGLELDRGRSIRPRDQVVLGEAAGLDVVLEQLLGEVLVHLGGLVGVHGIATRLVQVPEQGRGPELHGHVWDLAGQLHGWHHHVVALLGKPARERGKLAFGDFFSLPFPARIEWKRWKIPSGKLDFWVEGRKTLKIPKDCLGLKGIKSQNSQGIPGVQGNKIPRLPGIPCDGKESDPKDLLGLKGIKPQDS